MGKFFGFIRDAIIGANIKKIIFIVPRVAAVWAVNFAILSIHVAVIGFIANYTLKAFVFVNNLINNLNEKSEEVFLQLLQSVGFFQALNDVFALFAPFLLSLFGILLSKTVINGLKSFRESFDSLNLARIE